MKSLKNFTDKFSSLRLSMWLSISSILIMCFVGCSATSSRDNEVVILKDYEHAFVLCGTAEEGGFIMVNNGHYHDSRLNELMALAATECGDNPELYYSNQVTP